MKKRTKIIIVCIIAWILMMSIDFAQARSTFEPKFCVKTVSEEGSALYIGIGYWFKYISEGTHLVDGFYQAEEFICKGYILGIEVFSGKYGNMLT